MSNFFRILVVTLLVWPTGLFLGCTKKSGSSDASGLGAGQELNLAIWANYLTDELAAKFAAKTGIKLNVSNYSSNEDLLAKIQSGASGIDVAVPSDYMVAILAKQGRLALIQKERIQNYSLLEDALLHQDFDQSNQYSLPYAWTTAGIAVNRELFKGKIESWKDLFESQELVGKFSLLDDVREASAAALLSIGSDVNTTDVSELKKAQSVLLKAKKNIKMFRSDTSDILVNREVAVAHAYSSDALKAWQKSGGKIQFVFPKEGATRAIDNLVILKSSKRIEAAHVLLDFLLSPEVNVEFVKTQFGGPVLKTTRSQLPEQLRNLEVLFPNPKIFARLSPIRDLGEHTLSYDELWTAVKTGN